MDWDEFTVERAVVHYVPTDKGDDQSELLLTDDAIRLDPGLQSYFRDKIAMRLSARAMEVVADPEQAQTVPDAVRAVLPDAEQLVACSKDIATHLHTVQSRVNSSGLLAVVLGQIAGVQPCVAVIKLEPERGVRYAISTVDGRHTVDLELLRNLTLTDKTKVYKTALLLEDGGAIAGWAADDQRTTASGTQVANFFLSRFLGCAPKLPAAITTFNFVRAASASINEDVKSPKQRSRYQVALLAVMQDNTTTIRPWTFAETNLEPEDRPAFLGRIAKAGIPPTTTFVKDTSRVNVSRFTMTFTSGNLTLVGDREALDTTVEIPEDDAAGDPVRLHTTVDDIITGR
jgi:hypothetical protein